MSGPGRDHGASSPAALNRAQYSSSSSTVRVVWTAMVASPHFMGSPRPAGPQPRDGLRLAYLHLPRLGRRGPSPPTARGPPHGTQPHTPPVRARNTRPALGGG